MLARVCAGAGHTGAQGVGGSVAGASACNRQAPPVPTRGRITDWEYGARARREILERDLLPDILAAKYEDVSGDLVSAVAASWEAVGPMRSLRLHGDCHLGNVLWNEHGPVFVDLDDCLAGPAIQDLWMLCSGSATQQQREWAQLMEGYEQFSEFDYGELRLVEPLRAVRMLNHAAWLAARWADPAFPKAFPWFADARYWERHIAELQEQLEAVEDPPLLELHGVERQMNNRIVTPAACLLMVAGCGGAPKVQDRPPQQRPRRRLMQRRSTRPPWLQFVRDRAMPPCASGSCWKRRRVGKEVPVQLDFSSYISEPITLDVRFAGDQVQIRPDARPPAFVAPFRRERPPHVEVTPKVIGLSELKVHAKIAGEDGGAEATYVIPILSDKTGPAGKANNTNP